jgi:hypothetical protein
MDPQRFDDLVRSFGAPRSRRAVLRSLLAGMVVALGLRNPESGAAGPSRSNAPAAAAPGQCCASVAAVPLPDRFRAAMGTVPAP